MSDRELLALMSAILFNSTDRGTKQDCVDDAVGLLMLIDRNIDSGEILLKAKPIPDVPIGTEG